RKKRLEQIKVDCYRNGGRGDKQYSGDGEDCTQMLPADPTTLPALGSSCPKSCSSYRKWIERKNTQYDKQQNAYSNQKENCKKGSDNGFCETLRNYNDAADFLEKLGPCSKINSGEVKKFFDKNGDTFKHAKDCAPCSKFKIKCENGYCSGGTNETCNGTTVITSENFEQMGQTAKEFVMRVSDKSGNEFQNDLNECAGADIFQGIKENKWTCGYVCGYDVCKPKNGNGQNDGTYIIQIRALFKRWLETFFEDYNKINDKISHCMKKGEGYKCIKECGKKCDCVGKWEEEKRKEWEEIKKRYLEQHKVTQSQVFEVKSFLQQGMFTYDVDKAIKPCDGLEKFQNSTDCTVAGSSESGKDGTQKDIVECLLDKLQTKANKCKDDHKPSGETQRTCDESSTPLVEDDDPLEEVDQNPEDAQKMIPKICGDVIQKIPKEKKEGGCEEAPTTPPEPAPPPPSEEQIEQTLVPKHKDEGPPPKKPEAPATPNHQPLPSDNTSDILKTTIPFGIAIALTSIVFLFLK
ncbi:hypothetical protein PFMALIP_05891, partial [Plasmodium falciparum MaliPS096_E11]